MMRPIRTSILSIRAIGGVLAASALIVVSTGIAGSATAAGTTQYLAQGDIGTSFATTGSAWLGEASNGGTYSVGTNPVDTATTLNLTAAAGNAQSRVAKTFGSASWATDVAPLLSGASYTYTGSNVVFSMELFFTPADGAYAPGGSSPCLQASAGGNALPGQCYTTIKWEPLLPVAGAWKTVDLSADTAANSETSTGGWKNTQRIGIYEKPGPLMGNTLTEYLAQMASYSVISYGLTLGSGTPNSEAWVKDLTVDGASYRFGVPAVPAPAVPAPVADAAALDALIAADPAVLPDTSAAIVVGGGASGAGLSDLDQAAPFAAVLPWSGSGDDFIDLYGYSSPVFLGTFPVVGGKVVLSGVDLSKLGSGAHRLVFIGQSSGGMQLVAVSVAEAADGATPAEGLPATGVGVALPVVFTGGLLLVLGASLLLLRLIRVSPRQ